MPIRTLLVDLFRHMEWADALVWSAVLGSPVAAEDAPLREKLYHFHSTQRFFLHLWRADEPRFAGSEELRGASLARWGREYHLEAARWLSGLPGEDLDRRIRMPFREWITGRIGREPSDPTLGEMMVQVATHSAYHRGQVNGRLRELGAEPPLVDYIAWVWLDRPGAHWPAEASPPT